MSPGVLSFQVFKFSSLHAVRGGRHAVGAGRHRLRAIAVLLAFFGTLGAAALSLPEAQRLARERYPLLRQYEVLRLTADCSVAEAAKAWLPEITASANATWQSAVAAYPSALKQMLSQSGLHVKGTSPVQYKAGVDVRQTIYDGGRIRNSQLLAQREREEAERETDVDLHQLAERVQEVYFGTLLLASQGEQVALSIELLRANIEHVRRMLKNGTATQSDVDVLCAEMLAAEQSLASIRACEAEYRDVLALYTGCAPSVHLEEPSECAPSASDDLSARAEWKLFGARIESLAAKREQVQTTLRPTVGAFAQAYYGYPGLDFLKAMMSRQPRPYAILGLTASWNISAFYTKKQRLARLDHAAEGLDVAREVWAFNTRLQTSRQRGEIERLRDVYQRDADIVALRSRVRESAEARVRNGVLDTTDLLARITDEKAARLAQAAHRIEYLQALYNLSLTLNISQP